MFGFEDEKPAEKVILFVDPKGVLYEDNHAADEMICEWNPKAVYNFKKIMQDAYNSRKEYRFVITVKKDLSLEYLHKIVEKYELGNYIADDMLDFLTSEDITSLSKSEQINRYLEQHKDIKRYAVLDNISNSYLELEFPLHCVFTQTLFSEKDALRVRRKMFFGTGWESDYMSSTRKEIEDGFTKVVFLDIDGVLNKDHTSGQKDEPKIEPEFVENLAEIVRKTGAEIVLSSSWRYGFYYIDKDSLSDNDKMLFKMMADNNMLIAGATPTIGNGPDGRPFEIKQWLAKRQSVKSFVILDDEDFWSWNWLSPFVVTTSYFFTENDRRKRISGLEKQYVDTAIQILNQFDKPKKRPD